MTVKRRGDDHESSAVSRGAPPKMDGLSIRRRIFLLALLQCFIEISHGKHLYQVQIPRKCCLSGHLFNDQFVCVNRTAKPSQVIEEVVAKDAFKCQYNESLMFDSAYQNNSSLHHQSYMTLHMPDDFCIEDTTNGTKVLAKCPDRQRSPILDLGAVVFWGAQTYMSTNIAHVVLCIVVVVIYLSVPALGRGLYNRAVVRHNICLMMHGVILQLLGFCELMGNCQFNDYFMIFWWLCLQYFTIATVFWLNVICFDMTLAITRFRWIGGSGNRSSPAEARKLFMYGLFTWGSSFMPTLMAGLCDYIPGVPKDFILKPNYLNFRNGPSFVVNMYFFLVPAFTLLLNNILFAFTTFRIIAIQRGTEMATRNQTNLLKKKYFLFLRLYLLMGAPWFFGMLLACFNKLVILKTCRLVQPSLWLMMLITHPEVMKKFKEVFIKYKPRKCTIVTISS